MTPVIVIPAAGASTRMRGRDKLLEPIDGKPLLRRQAEAALASGCPVLVALPPESPRNAALEDLPVTVVTVADAAEGMGATLRALALFIARHTPDRPMAVLLPDVPGIRTSDIASVIARFGAEGGDTPLRATDEAGQPGTPLVVPPRLLSGFAALTGDDGGKSVLKGETVLTLTIPGDRATRDLDTPEDWDAWRRKTGPTG